VFELQTEKNQINYDLTNLQKVITQADFPTCARKVHQNMFSSVYASHVELMNKIQKKIEELELEKSKKDAPRNDFLKKVKEKWVQEAKDKNYSTVPNYEKPQELCTAFGYNTSDATIRTASERNRDVMLSSAIQVHLEMTNVKRNELIQLQNNHTFIPIKVGEEELEKKFKSLFTDIFKKQWAKKAEVTYELSNIKNLYEGKAASEVVKDKICSKIQDIAFEATFNAHNELLQKNDDDLKKIEVLIGKDSQLKQRNEELEKSEAKFQELQEELKKAEKKIKEANDVAKNKPTDYIPIKDIKDLIQNIKHPKKDKIEKTSSSDKNIVEAINAINDLLESNLKASQKNSEGDKALDLIKKLAASIENKETVDSDEFEISEDAGKINNAIKDFQKHKDTIKDFQRYKDAINSLREIAEGKNDEKKDVALQEAKPIVTEMETLRALEKCYRTTTIILIVSIAIGVLAYLFMQCVLNKPEEKTEDQSDEQSYDKADKKTAKETDKKIVKKIDEKSAEKVERAVQNIDEKAIDKVNEENQVSKEAQDTNNLATNEAKKGHVLIDVKE
jgi:hypothetical protein